MIITREFTKEQLIARINQVTAINKFRISRDSDADGLVMDNELFAIALASLEADKSIFYRERNPYNGMATGWQELTQKEYEFVKDNASDNAEFRTVYTTPPAPVVRDDLAGKSFEYIANKFQVSISDAQWVLVGWNACRAAMHGKAVSQPKLPDGYCIMPTKLTAGNGAKGALSGEFHVTHRIICQSCGGEGCEDCNEDGGWDAEIPIGWDTIKRIHEAAVEACALPAAPQQEVKP